MVVIDRKSVVLLVGAGAKRQAVVDVREHGKDEMVVRDSVEKPTGGTHALPHLTVVRRRSGRLPLLSCRRRCGAYLVLTAANQMCTSDRTVGKKALRLPNVCFRENYGEKKLCNCRWRLPAACEKYGERSGCAACAASVDTGEGERAS